MAVTGSLHATERQVHFGADGGCVDVSDTGFQVAHGAKRLVDVARVHSRRQPVLHPISDSDCIFHAVAWNYADNGSENFLLRDAHLGIDVGEHSRLHEPPVVVFATGEPVAAAQQFRAFVLADFNVIKVRLELRLVDGGTHVGGLVQAIADFQAARPLHQFVSEVPVHAFLHDDSAGRGAALARGTERAPQRAVECEFQIRVIEHNHRIFAAQFERAALEALGGGLADHAANFGRSGQ